MTEKEKAEAYDEAIERAKKLCSNRIVEEIFYELKESEDDKIRKEIISILRNAYWTSNKNRFNELVAWLENQDKQEKQVHFPKFTFDDVLALQCCMETVKKVQEDKELYEQLNLIHSKMYDAYWIEKECEQTNECAENKQKCADKIESKFHKGDWITIDKPCQIINIHDNGNYIVQYCNDEKTHELSKNFCESYFHFWTIQDAKDGDVLEFEDHGRFVIGILSFVNKKTGKVDVSCLLECNKFKVGVFYNLDTVNPHPATKEQRDFLFQKIKEAGYEWDADKKELKKLVPNKFDPNTLKPFDKVLIRDHSTEKWDIGHFSYIEYDLAGFDFSDCEEEGDFLVYTAGEVSYWYAVPYNEDTKHLVGTTDEAPEYYRYWED